MPPIKKRVRRKLTDEEIAAALLNKIKPHEDHPWHRVGRCVYCGPCGVRLFQGTLPASHAVYIPPTKSRKSTASDQMRALWGKE